MLNKFDPDPKEHTMAEQKFLIVMRSGPIPGSSYYIEKDEVFIGRDLTNDLPVPDPEISAGMPAFCAVGTLSISKTWVPPTALF